MVSTQKCLKICHWNLNGYKNNEGSKLDDVMFLKCIQGFDIIGLTETHTDNVSYLKLNGYKTYQINRPKHKKAKSPLVE